jgi:hypothetical protein
VAGFVQHGGGFAEKVFVAHAGDKAALQFKVAAGREDIENGLPEGVKTFARQRGNAVFALYRDERGQIALVGGNKKSALLAGFGDEVDTFLGVAGGAVDDDDGEIGVGHGLKTALDAELLDALGGMANAGGVDNKYRNSG